MKREIRTKATRRALGAAIAALVLAYSGTAWVQAMAAEGENSGASGEWAAGLNSKARLIAGHASGKVYAGVEIEMEPGWKTYWRFPGEAGVPPEFDFSASDNLKSADVLYPAPHRLKDPKAGDAVGYKDGVVFPVALAPSDPAKPIALRGKITYGVCKDLCIPAELEVELSVPPDVTTSGAISDALAKVPATAPAAGAPVLKSWRLTDNGGKPQLLLEVASDDAAKADVFLVPPSGLYLALPTPVGAANGIARFSVDLTDGVDVKELKGKSIDAVVVDGKGQSKSSIVLE